MTEQTLSIAEEITEMLFLDGIKRVANRLVLEYPLENNQLMMDGTGWGKDAVKSKIIEILSNRLDKPVKPANGGKEKLFGYMYEIIARAIHTLRNYRFENEEIEEFLKEMERKHFYNEKFDGKYI